MKSEIGLASEMISPWKIDSVSLSELMHPGNINIIHIANVIMIFFITIPHTLVPKYGMSISNWTTYSPVEIQDA